MHVTVKLFATLRDGRFDERVADCPAGSTALDLARLLCVPDEKVALIMINGRHAEWQTALSDGDILALFPPVGGG